MSDFLNRMKVQESRAALPGLAKQLQRLQMDLGRQLASARSFTDPDLSADGLQKRRQELADQARQRADQQVTALTTELNQHTGRVREWAESRRPTVPDDAAKLARMSIVWDNVRRQLDAGLPVRQVLASTTDPLGVLAVREWAPDYLRAAAPRVAGLAGLAEPVDYSGLVRAADERLGELRGGEVASAVEALREVDRVEAGWRVRSAHVAGGLRDPLAAAIEADLAEQMAGATWQDPADGAA